MQIQNEKILRDSENQGAAEIMPPGRSGRRLWPLVLTQSCGALNDNLVRNAMIGLALFQLHQGGASLAAAAGALFMAPYILLSATAGQLADRFAKHRVIRWTKLAELALMLAAAAAFASQSLTGLLAVLGLLGVQGAVFGPVKYGILPELLPESTLVRGNAMIEATTFLAIVAGTVLGGQLIGLEHGAAWVGGTGIALALLGAAAAWAVPATPPADPTLRIGWNIAAETWAVTRQAMAAPTIGLCILALSWFWALGAVLMAEIPVVARDMLSAGLPVMSLLLTCFAVGIGLGSAACNFLLGGAVSARQVPAAALAMSVVLWDFASACTGAQTAGLHTIADLLSHPAGLRLLADLTLSAVFGGAFSVPLYALLQDISAPSHRARIIAGNNVVNAIFMVGSAVAMATLGQAGLGTQGMLRLTAVLNLGAVILGLRLLPHDTLRPLFRWYFRSFHRVRVTGLENFAAAGDRVVIVANHLSFGDAALISAFMPEAVSFAIDTRQSRRFWIRIISAPVRTFPVDIHNPYAIKTMIEAVRDQREKLVVFPEGRITQTGALMKVYEGAGVVADRAGAKVLPITLDGLQFNPLGRMQGKLKIRWFVNISITVHRPVTLLAADRAPTHAHIRRHAAGAALERVMVNAAFAARDTNKTLFRAVLDARATHGGDAPIAEDIGRDPLSFDRLVLGSAALGRALANATAGETYVGLMLPNANAALVALLGLGAFGRVPAMLNFTAGAAGMLAACKAARITKVVSSRAFIEKAKLEKIVERMQGEISFIWLEDVRGAIGLAAKLRAKFDASRAAHLPGAQAGGEQPAVVLFTSGSEGAPKGVVLSHTNILANCAQISAVIDFNPSDRVFNALPMFHAFGLVAGTLLPLLHGVRVFLYPSPLHYRAVPSLIYDTDATLCFGTDTFLTGWSKYAHPYDFYKMRYIFAGAEKLRDTTRQLFADKFGVRVLEGYGATETAPVLALNTAMHARAGTVGRLLPGIEHRTKPVPGVNAEGVLSVRGPNIMLGYLRPTNPGVLEPPKDGWYDTGDIVDVDADGFVHIAGRVKRFAKIAGEMISMAAAESLAASLWPTAQHAVLAVPDPRRGEQLLLLTTQQAADLQQLNSFGRSRGMAEIALPRSIITVETIPLLGTGKINYPEAQVIADGHIRQAA